MKEHDSNPLPRSFFTPISPFAPPPTQKSPRTLPTYSPTSSLKPRKTLYQHPLTRPSNQFRPLKQKAFHTSMLTTIACYCIVIDFTVKDRNGRSSCVV